MSARLLDGSPIAKHLLKKLSSQIAVLEQSGGKLVLATVQVGQSKDAVLYAKSLSNLLTKHRIRCVASVSPETISEEGLIAKIRKLNGDPAVTGILVFAPLPGTMDAGRVLSAIDPCKDAEGRTFLKNHLGVFSPTANAVLTLIGKTGVKLQGKSAVVVGHSDLVGKPVAVLLMDAFATVTVCHAKTRRLESHVRGADIVVAAAGKPGLIKGAWIKKGAVVIDVGENIMDGKLVGDVEKNAASRAAYLSPVPGGVGPLTNVMLIRNLVRLRQLKVEN